MPRTVTTLLALVLLLAPLTSAAATVAVGDAAPDFRLPDLDGREVTLSEFRGKVVVLQWMNPNCPFIARHAREGTMTKIVADHPEIVSLNCEHGIEPRTILKEIHNPLVGLANLDYHDAGAALAGLVAEDEATPLPERISRLEREMRAAAKRLEFEEAAMLRDRIRELRELQIFRG